MIAAIVCPGPSLRANRRWEYGRVDVLLAVNRAMDHAMCNGADYWVALDLWHDPAIPELVLPWQAPLDGMVTSQAAIDEGQAAHVPWRLQRFDQHPKARPVSTTLPGALWWAAHLGASEAKLYGCDMVGDRDSMGIHLLDCAASRWEREARECRDVERLTGMRVMGLPR